MIYGDECFSQTNMQLVRGSITQTNQVSINAVNALVRRENESLVML